MELISIDQNCHPLWDVPPKLHALARAGHSACHYIEDIDVAFTSIGARPGDNASQQMRVARERFYRGGSADWGAAVFYFCFLGRQPAEIRRYEQYTGMRTSVLAGKLKCSVDDLYDRFSPSDNWQLIGSSYFRDQNLHRVIGDLRASQTAGFLADITDLAREDMLQAFPARESRRRIEDWVAAQRRMLAEFTDSVCDGSLVDVYSRWLGQCVGEATSLGLTSQLFACGRDEAQTALLELFTSRYDETAEMYNSAIAETNQPLRPLDVKNGELPLFATIARDGHLVRCGVSMRDGSLEVADMRFDLLSGGRIPIDPMRDSGVAALAGKAMVLVMQARIGPSGRPLALPHRGSLYMPAADRLAEKLKQADLLPGELQPIVRVRLGFLDALKALDTPIRPPEYLQEALGSETIPASLLAARWRDLITDARASLKALTSPEGRDAWRRQNQGPLLDDIERINQARRQLAKTDPKGPEIRSLSKRARELETRILDAMVRRIAGDLHTVELDYWDSRGAILPWSIALGGNEFYNDLISNAEILVEAPGSDNRK